jgi:phage baseplate assembly protein gpV
MSLYGKYPAIVRTWDRARRECRVEIPGVTDGAEVLPLAEIAYPIGDKSEHTEIYVTLGDRVWVEFERGDPRFPIITHWRTKHTGNAPLWRKFHHENHEREAFDGDIHDTASNNINTEAGNNEQRTIGTAFTLDAGTTITLHVGGSTLVIDGSSVTITTAEVTVDSPQSTFTGAVTVLGLLTYAAGMSGSPGAGGGAGATISGNIAVTSGNITTDGDVTAGSISLKNHTHGGVQPGGSSTSPPT